MDWKKFLLLFLRNMIIGTALGGLVLGGIGFLLAGREGFVNMATWGLLLGFLGSISTGFAMLVSANYWTGYARRYGKSWFKKISEEDDDQKDY